MRNDLLVQLANTIKKVEESAIGEFVTKRLTEFRAGNL